MDIVKKISPRLVLVFIYTMIGILWILLSDTALLFFVKDAENLTTYQSYKGWTYVLATTGLLYLLLLWYEKKMHFAEESKEQTEKKFNLLFEDAPNPYQSLDSNGNILAVNNKWLSLLGYKEEEVIGRWFGDMLTQQSVIDFKENFKKFKDNGHTHDVLFDMLTKNGEILSILLHGQITFDENHSVIQTHCSFEDISDKHKIEHLNRVLKLIRDVNQTIVRMKNHDELLEESCTILSSAHLYNHVWIEIDQDHPSKLYYSSDQAEELKAFKDKIANEWTPACVDLLHKERSTCLFIKDINNSCQTCPLENNTTALEENAYLLELKHDNTHYGYLTVSSFSKFEEEESELLKEVAGDIAYGLFNIETEQILKENEERYRFAVEGASDGLWDWNLVNNTMYYSPRWKEIIGYSDNQLKNSFESWETHLHPDDKEQSFLAIKSSHEGHNPRYHNIHRLRHKDGHWVWIESRGQTLYDESGKAVRMIGSHTDITKLKESEMRLQFSNEKFEKAFNYTPNIIIITRRETGEIYDVNKTFETVFGEKKEDVVGKTTFDINLWHDIKDREKYMKSFDEDGRVDGEIYKFSTHNKTPRTTKVYANLITINNDKYIITVAEDITEQNRLYSLLQKSQEQAKLGSWEYTTGDENLFWSNEVYNIFEIKIKELMPHKEFVELVHPDDRSKVFSLFDKSVEEHKAYYVEHRLLLANGETKYVVERAEHFYDKENKYIRSAGTLQDITEKKVLEQEVEKGNETLHKLADNIPGALYQYRVDRDGKASFPYANKGIEIIYEVSPRDVQENAQLVFDILHPDDYDTIQKTIQDSAQTMQEWNLDYRVKLPQKGVRWLRGKARPEKLEDGSVLWNGFITDITDQLLVEAEVKKREALFSSIFKVIPDLLFIMEEDGKIIDYRAQEDNDLYSKPELFLGKYPQEILPPAIGKLFKQNIESISQNLELNIFRYELEIKGEIRHYEARMAQLPLNNHVMTIIRDISEQISYEQKLLFQSQLLEQSIAATSVVDEDRTFSYVNDAYVKMWGYDTKEEILRITANDVCEDANMPQKIIDKVEKDGSDIFVFKAKRKDGTLFDALMAVQYFHYMGKKHYFSSTVDVTENQDNLRELEQKKKELEEIIMNAPNPMMLHNEDGKVLMVNQAWLDSSGYSVEEIPTIDAWVESILDDVENRISLKKQISLNYKITTKVDEGEFTFLNKAREKTTWNVSSARLGLMDGKHTVISSAMDITELKHKDEMLINQSRNAAMGEMISMIAHQWRQPLSTISMDANNMLLDIAIDNFSASEAEKYAHNIAHQTQHLSQTIDDFRNFFKPDKEISKVKIKNTLEQTLSIVQDSLRNNNIELTSDFETETEVNAYPRELMQVFVNIITNAKDALVQNKTEAALIKVRVYEDEAYINTEICDNGGGIDADVLPKIFDPYFSTKDEKNGTGLGLYMSKMIIENHLDGIIEALNKDDGACFIIRLLKEKALS